MMDALWLYVAFCAGSLAGALIVGLLAVARWSEERSVERMSSGR